MTCPRYTRRCRLTGLFAVLAFAAGAALAQPDLDSDTARAFDDAQAEYERNHWSDAYQAMGRLADRGHPEAARIALLMWRHGPALYGQRFQSTPYQQLHWAWLQQCGDACSAPSGNAAMVASGC